MKKLIIIPRWSGTPVSDFYPWLTGRLGELKTFSSVTVLSMPDPEEPRIETWTPVVMAHLGTQPAELANTVLMGHSVGCQAALHAIAALPEGSMLGALIGVAGWWEVDQPWPSIRPWITSQHDFLVLAQRAPLVHLLLSENDPFTSDHRQNAELWRSRLNAQVHWDAQAQHFNAAQEPAVLALLQSVAS